MDETYIKVKGKCVYHHRAVDKYGSIIDFYLSETRNEQNAQVFFDKAVRVVDCQVKLLSMKVVRMQQR